ncbi:hypothetical protein [Spirosoma endbachense]|uniref:Uncharacterized protein n=1 Tax=Spirosoma endbachense TaxID=2666025 RepID=A0A6P1W908_9BACT|nr:hypothetical protein [Spirosoma endbachense]QHW01049.1 hypothetical protein GJR95_41135 [Spirosoma endbachense]
MEAVNGIMYEKLMLGDIIFVSANKGIGSIINKIGQIIIFHQKPKDSFIPTHVAIATGLGYNILHATKGSIKHKGGSTERKGVHYSSLMEFINDKGYSANILIYRNINLEDLLKDDTNRKVYNDKLKKYWGKKYSTLGTVIRRSIKGRLYCSELAMEFLKSLEVVSQTISSAKTYPIQLLDICQKSNEWRLANPDFSNLLNIRSYEERYQNAMKSKDSVMINHYQTALERCKKQVDTMIDEDISSAKFFNSGGDMDLIIKTLEDTIKRETESLKDIIRVLKKKHDDLLNN